MPDPEPPTGMRSAAPGAGTEPPVLHSTRLPPAPAALRDTLEDQPRTGELRDALDELRATLDTPGGGDTRPARIGRRFSVRLPAGPGTPASDAAPEPAPVAVPEPATGPAERHPGRRALVAAAVLALVVAVAAAAVAGAASGRRRPAAAGSASRATSTPGRTPTPGPSPADSPGAPPATATRPLPWPGGAVLVPPGLPRSGPGADAPGSELTAAIDPDGRHVDVYERAVLRPGTTSVLLSPAPAAVLPGVLRDLRPSVEDLQAEVDGRPVVPSAAGDGWRVAAPGDITRVVLRYRLGGALVRQEPAPPGRASLLLRPLSGPAVQAAADPVVVRIDDRRVGGLYCPAPRPVLCGASAGTVLTATVPPGAGAVVLAQVTL